MKQKVHIINTFTEEQLLRQTEGAWGYDLKASKQTIIDGYEYALIPTGIYLARRLPDGVMMGILPRSSLFMRHGLLVANSLGVIDQDYTGEIKILVYATRQCTIDRGERIAQVVFFNVALPDIIVSDEQQGMKERGGFGSTGA
jgi:dUTP pyrophosphatase